METGELQFLPEKHNKYFISEEIKNEKEKDENFEKVVNFYVNSLTDKLNEDDYDEFSSPAFDIFLKKEGPQKTLDLIESVYFNKNLSEEDRKIFLNNIIVEELSFPENFLEPKEIFEFIEELTKRFDLKTKDKEEQKRTKKLLEIFRNLKTLIYTSYEEMLEVGGYEKDKIKDPEEFFADIKELSKEKENNYFLSLRLRKIVDENVFYYFEEPATDKDVYPFRLSKKIFALYDKTGELKITQKNDYEEVESYFNIIDLYRRYKELEKEYLTLQSELIEKYFQNHPEETENYRFPKEVSFRILEGRFDNTVFTKGSIYGVEDKIEEEFKQNEYFFKKFPKAKAEIGKKMGDLEDKFFQLRGQVFNAFGEDENGRINTEILERYEHKIEKFFHKITSLEDIDFFTEKQKQDFADNLDDYKFLMSKPIREAIDEEFGIDITQFSALEQSYFLQFLKDKTNQEVDQVKEFLKQSKSEQSKSNRIKSFLSLEQDPQMGEIILSIGEKLKDESKLADEIFGEYAKMVDNVNNHIDFFVQIYKEIFPNQELDKNKATQTILRKASSLIKQAFEELKDASETEKEKIIKRLISNLRHQEKVNRKILNDLIHISKLFNQSKKKLKDELFLQGGEHAIASELFGNPEQYKTPQELDEAIKKGEISPWWMDENFDMEKILDKIDSSVLKKIIQASQKSVKKLEAMLHTDGYYEMAQSENAQNFGKSDKIDKKIFTRIKDKIEKANRKIDKAKKVLQFQKNLENEIMELIYDQVPNLPKNIETNIADLVFQKYNEIINQARKGKEEIRKILAQSKELNEEKVEAISDNLLEYANQILNDYIEKIGKEKIDEEVIAKELEQINGRVILLSEITKQLSIEELGQIDLRKIKDIERMENVSGKELLKNKKVLAQIQKIIRKQFPAGDDEVFLQECQNNPNLKLTIVLINNEIVSFFGKEKKQGDIEYIDWFISNPDAKIKGLGEATLRLGFNSEEDKEKLFYAVAKPHVRSFLILIERLNFVSFAGSTKDNEYKDHYARTRRFPEDTLDILKNFNSEEEKKLEKILKTQILTENKITTINFQGEKYPACKIAYHGQDHHDDITENDPDGWIFKAIAEQHKNGYVLSRFIPEEKSKTNQNFYVIFSPDKAKKENQDKLDLLINNH